MIDKQQDFLTLTGGINSFGLFWKFNTTGLLSEVSYTIGIWCISILAHLSTYCLVAACREETKVKENSIMYGWNSF